MDIVICMKLKCNTIRCSMSRYKWRHKASLVWNIFFLLKSGMPYLWELNSWLNVSSVGESEVEYFICLKLGCNIFRCSMSGQNCHNMVNLRWISLFIWDWSAISSGAQLLAQIILSRRFWDGILLYCYLRLTHAVLRCFISGSYYSQWASLRQNILVCLRLKHTVLIFSISG